MDDRVGPAIRFLEKYTGKSAPLLLKKELEKTGIDDLNQAKDLQLMNLTDAIVKDILTPILSQGRIPLARSELMGVFALDAGFAGVPVEVDGVRVLPEDIHDLVAEHYLNANEFIMKQEMERYGLKDFKKADSPTRVRVLEAFVEHHFGHSGKVIIDCKIDELGVRNVCSAPFYNKILLMEYILQCMLLFYVKPLKAKILRSELVTILGIDLEMAQGPVDYIERAGKRIDEHKRNTYNSPCARRAKVEFEDLMFFLLKRESSRRGIANILSVRADIRNAVVSSVLSQMLGGMCSHVFSRLDAKDERIKSRFLAKFLRNYLGRILPTKDADELYLRVVSSLGIGL
jgi:hypothetical protein